MKAAILEKYASDGRELVVKDVPVPEVGDNEVLVNIKAAGVNPLDNMIVRGEVKLIVPYKFPLVMGNEFAGVVEKAGGKVTEFKKGDRVYARMPLDKIGAFAEYASVRADALAKIPDYLSFEEAASQLDTIVEKLNSGAVKLDEMMTLYEKGVALSNHCMKLLNEYDGRIEKAMKNTQKSK